MDKRERYLEFIVDDLIKKTEFPENHRVMDVKHYIYPFGIKSPHPFRRKDMNISFAYINMSLESNPDKSFFAKYVTSNYGVGREELEELLVRYFNGLFDILDEEIWGKRDE